MLPDRLRDTDQRLADCLVGPWGPSTSTPETKAKPETAEPWGRLSPLIPDGHSCLLVTGFGWLVPSA